MYIDTIINKLLEYGIKRSDMKGCAIDEVNLLEKVLNHKLPKAYKEFLLTMGHGVGPVYFEEERMLYNSVLSNAYDNQELVNDYNEEMIEEGCTNLLSKDTFFFSYDNRNLYEYYFLLGDPSPNPPVYSVNGYDLLKATDTFTDFLVLVTDSSKEYLDYRASSIYKDRKMIL